MIPSHIRLFATLAAAVGLATCADAPSAAVNPSVARGTAARLGFQPVFSLAARTAAAHLADFGITFDRVRVVIVRPVADTVKDTTITFLPGQADVTLDLSVNVHADGESFGASIDYSNPGGIVFHGTGTVQAHAADQPAPAQQITVQYAGPGATVTRVVLSPKSTAVSGRGTVNYTATAFDASNTAVPGTPFSWTTSDATIGTISSTGTLTTTGKRGTVTVTASTPTEASDNASVTVTLPATGLVLVSGSGQTGKAGSTLPQPGVVRVTASDGLGVGGVVVNFAAPAGGRVGSASVTSDANGLASTSLTLGGALGPQSFAAAALGLSVSLAETATLGDPAAVAVVSGSGQSDTVKHALRLPLVAKVTDQFGNGVAGITVSWTRTAGGGTVSAATSVSGADGTASVGYTLGTVVGTETITASAGAASPATFTETALSSGPAAIAVVSGDAQTARILQALAPFVVKVTDDAGNPVSGATVTWTATNGTLSATTTTDASGQTSNTMTLGSASGTAGATASAGGKTVRFTVTVQTGLVSKIIFLTQPPASAPSGTRLVPAIRVALQDAGGNLSAATNAVTIALGQSTNGGVLSGTLTRNAVAGIATFDDLIVDKVGSGYTLVASSNNVPTLTSTAFAIVPGTPGRLTVVAGDAQTGTVNTPAPVVPVVRLVDLNNNPIPGASVTFTADEGSGTVFPTGSTLTNSAGLAALGVWTLGQLAGPQSLTVSTPGVANVTIHATAQAGAPAHLVVTAVPTTQVAGTTTSVTAQLIDAFNNPVAASGHTVLWTSTGGGSFATPSNVTGSNGATPAVAFTTSTSAGVTHTLTATDAASSSISGIASVTTTAGPPARLAIITQPPTNAQSGVVMPATVIQLRDVNNNPSPQSGVTVTASISTGGGTLGGTTSVVTDALGRATFGNLRLNGIVGARTLAFTSTGLTGAVSSSIALAAGPAARVAFSVNPTNTSATVAFSPTVAVRVLDADGNTLTTATNSVTLAITNGTGTSGAALTGTVTVAATGGVASFPGIAVDLPGNGYTITATSTGLTAGVSSAFNVSSPPPTLSDVSPAVVDAVFATVPITFSGSNFITTGTTPAVTGGNVAVANVVVSNSTSMTSDFNITGGAATHTESVTLTSVYGTSNALPFDLYSVGSAPVQLGGSFGDSGGSPYSLDCPSGAVATGLNVRGGSNVDQLQVICQTVSGPSRIFGSSTFTAAVGGSGGSPATLTCPSNYVLTGLTGRIGSGGGGLNDEIAGVCSPLNGGSSTTTTSVGSNFSGSIGYTSTCPSGLALTGIQGGAGSLLDRTQIKCR